MANYEVMQFAISKRVRCRGVCPAGIRPPRHQTARCTSWTSGRRESLTTSPHRALLGLEGTGLIVLDGQMVRSPLQHHPLRPPAPPRRRRPPHRNV
jgi:hypothetical protein